MRKLLLSILIILTPNYSWCQDYFFEFVDGWVNNYCIELNNEYHFLGLGVGDNPTEHFYLYNLVDNNGQTFDQVLFEIDQFQSTSSMLTSQLAVNISDNEIAIGGNLGVDSSSGEVHGSIVYYNLITQTFEFIGNYSGSNNTRFFNVSSPNDSTLLIGASLTDFGMAPKVSLYNFDMEGTERWRQDIASCSLSYLDPIQILPLSNGNIAYMYEKFEDLPQFTDRERAIIVVLDGETGDQIGEPILVGDHENYRIWAGGMVEQDGELLVSYTQPYYYDMLSNISYLDEIPNGIVEIGRYQYRVSQMQYLSDGNLLISGTTGYGGLLMKISPSGELFWNREYFPHEFEENTSLVWNTRIYYATESSDGGFLCAGQYYSDPGILYPEGIQTAIALKVDEYGCLEPGCQVGIEEYENQPLSIYPNPSEGRFVIDMPALRLGSGTYDLSVYNSLGEVVLNESYRNLQERLTIDLSDFSIGIYFVQLNIGGVNYSSQVVKE